MNIMMNIQEVSDFFVEVQETGLRDLTAEQQQILDDNNIELSVARNTDQIFYLIIPAEDTMMYQINDENLNSISAAKADCAGTAGTAGTVGTASTLFPVTASTYSSVGSIGTAGTASSNSDIDVIATRLRAQVVREFRGDVPSDS